jgi:tetratricopeptide (TPR) repeat protein
MLGEALRYHQAGRLGEAAKMYGQILALDARHADSLHLLGMASYQAGLPERAVDLIQRAISVNGNVALYHSNFGTILQGQGLLEEAAIRYARALDLDPNLAEVHINLGLLLEGQGKVNEAVARYRRALALKPKLAEAHSNLGNALRTQGKLDEAVARYERALVLKPDFAEAHYNFGNVLQTQGKTDEAKARFEQALALKPTLAEAHCHLGNILQSEGKHDEAVARYEQALLLNPNYAEAHYNFGNALQVHGDTSQAIERYEWALALKPNLMEAHHNLGKALETHGRFDQAIAHYEQTLAIRPDYAEAHNSLGVTLMRQGKRDEAIPHFEQALALKPTYAAAYTNLGNVLVDVCRPTEAVVCHERALALKPDFVEAHCGLGAALHVQGKIGEAIEHFERALAVKPDSVQAKLSLSMVQLLLGDFSSGWRNYEVRHQQLGLNRNFLQPQWSGEPLNGARILIHAEQGLGDCIQFLRYIPMVQLAGGTVVLEIPVGLRRLATQLTGVTDLVSSGESLPQFDWHCPLMSLPLAFGTSLETIPAHVPYIPIPEDARHRAATHSWPAEGLRVGLVWAGNPTNNQDRYRSIPPSLLEPLHNLNGVHLFSLQVGHTSGEGTETGGAITDLASVMSDMADTAAILEQLDLIISVDTSVAHLAGALGRPIWLLLPFTADWRWLQAREDSPWYPTMRLFRQPKLGDWEAVIEEVHNALCATARQRQTKHSGVSILKPSGVLVP